ncbi:hypothetical protein BDF20DRAFT_852105 [Mycotypha africana]|uniref:uncharacterized protein n=1 Tax=Mycotypha africana TaxID=64632 RepID=UPI002301DFE0|nr:uncharacterized protein BDF20DRAFT_852105 [Mycotypha africana]KAI8987764.1 hypothetical protein BDF20DRAFT_852105 [Mycotypha africana]
MSSCLPCVKVKHRTYVNNCYPPLKDNNTQPRSSELSYLTFYASSRPAKLTKVGSYFLTVVIGFWFFYDLQRQNLVSLRIIKELIQTCHRNLNIFSKNVVRILNEMLDTRDIELLDFTCETFITLCRYLDCTSMAVDSDFMNDYQRLIGSFAGFCNYSTKDNSLDLKMRYIGHRALQAAVTSNGLQASNFKSQLSILLPPLMNTLASTRHSVNFTHLGDGTVVDIEESALDNEKINLQAIESIAAHTVSLLFSKVTGPFVRRSLTPLFSYLDENKKWWPPYLAINILKLVLESLQPQYRYLLVSEVLQQLDDSADNTNSNIVNDKHTALVCVLDTILNANVSLVGISVLEILNYLFSFLIKTTKHNVFEPDADIDHESSNEIHNSNDLEKYNREHANIMQHKLIHSIGGLATQIYYSNQLNDMFNYLTSKLRTNTTLDEVDNLPIHDYRLIVLTCMESIIHSSAKDIDSLNASSSESATDQVMIKSSTISSETWNSALGLLQDNDPRTRNNCSRCLCEYLQTKPSVKRIDGLIKRPLTADPSELIFMERLVYTMYDWAMLPQFNQADLRYFYSFLCLLNYKFGIDATLLIIPLVFKIQQCIQDNRITINTRQKALQSALVAWFKSTAEFYNIESLHNYVTTLEDEGAEAKLDLPDIKNESEKMIANYPNDMFEENDDINMDDVGLIDRSVIVELMSNDGNLRDEIDTYGLDLEAKLFAEWGSDAYLARRINHGQFRNIHSRLLQDTDEDVSIPVVGINKLKPKLVSPWLYKNDDYLSPTRSSLLNSSAEDKQPQCSKGDDIRVSTLKDALVRQQAPPTDDDSLSGTQSNSNRNNHSKATSLSRDIDDILNELHLDQKTTTTMSLVNPPYQSILS